MKLLLTEQNPPINEIMKTAVTPKQIDLLNINYPKRRSLQFEASCALTNICSGS